MQARTTSVFLALVLVGSRALCAEPGFLGADEVRTLITGKTIEVLDETGGSTFRVYFDSNGLRSALQGEGEYQLPWRILEDGTHCVRTGTGDDCARIRSNGDGTYMRVRGDSPGVRWLRILPGKDLMPPGIHARRRSPTDFEFTLVSPFTLDAQQAQSLIARAATSACGELMPVPGKYRFEASEALGAGDAARTQGSYRFVQEVACVARGRAPTVELPATPAAPEDPTQIEADIRRRSESYFRLIAAGQLELAYTQVSPIMGVDAATWSSGKRPFHVSQGEPVRVTIAKITVYDNPAQAREPGLYVAADFSNEYPHIPVHCGYLIWFRPPGGEFRITREETGHVTAGQWNAIPVAQHAELRQRLRCIAP